MCYLWLSCIFTLLVESTNAYMLFTSLWVLYRQNKEIIPLCAVSSKYRNYSDLFKYKSWSCEFTMHHFFLLFLVQVINRSSH